MPVAQANTVLHDEQTVRSAVRFAERVPPPTLSLPLHPQTLAIIAGTHAGITPARVHDPPAHTPRAADRGQTRKRGSTNPTKHKVTQTLETQTAQVLLEPGMANAPQDVVAGCARCACARPATAHDERWE